MNLFVIGLGYTAQRFVDLHGRAFARITGTVRSADKRARLAPADVAVFDGTSAAADTLAKAAAADVVLISVPPGSGEDPSLTAFGEAITMGRARRVVYLSTVGVYGDHQGAWIDEDTPLAPEHDRVQARVRVEDDWRGRIGDRLTVLRLGGIYGPGRNALVELRAGRARRIVKPGQVFNRIHVDDAAAAILGAIRRDRGGAWNIVDDEPAPPQDVIAYAASLMGVPPPPELPFDSAELSPMAKSFYASNRRIRNIRAKQELGLVFAYPTYRAGLDALWAAGEGR
ncbi:NAD(P)-dependent oxidoreductase [Bradyrhizobium sp. SSBR45G]|uniref:SDR family oxidoreductase n=1 Tax=unclassified Bradyrhizobium TaxID=2631580 RepID=UPI0023428DC9|nr:MULTISPECIES: SDR family oxidoreductase [unclassified Bradyrhizobium]GLH79188.1 NAD(P)-dependent oxidoreductase [Bradyrhizobium sp. SSBR45G]GLH84623.1 NAD(P)-dependent oxidoreductase [Bradyrhizobium sp. SSBR45R]